MMVRKIKEYVAGVLQFVVSKFLYVVAHVLYPTLIFCYVFIEGIKVNPDDSRIFVSYVCLCIYVLVLLGLVWWTTAQSEQKLREAEARSEQKLREAGAQNEENTRNARYAQAVKHIHGATHRVRDASRYLDRCLAGEVDYESATLKDLLKPCMDSVSRAFTVVTGVSNRASIKLLSPRDSDGVKELDSSRDIDSSQEHLVNHVRTFCRDSVSATDFFDMDKEERDQHKVNANTAYHEILYCNKVYFLSNNVQAMGDHYHSTGYPNGKLPYKARIVLPIRYVLTDREMHSPVSSESRIIMVGFLSVNANEIDVYREPYDVELGLAIADALFSVLKRAKIADMARRNKKGG